MMGKPERRKVELEAFLADDDLHKRFRIDTCWLPELPRITDTQERYDAAMASCRPYDGGSSGHLVIASPLLRTERNEMLLFSFPVSEIYGVSLVAPDGGACMLQIQSVQKGTIIGGYRELTISEDGRALTRVGYFRPNCTSYSIH